MSNQKYYPKKRNSHQRSVQHRRKHYHNRSLQPSGNMNTFFNGNLARNMRFGVPNNQLSGYVKRELSIKDRDGNETKASEEQFFNSSSNPMRVRINGKESDQ